MKSVALGKVVKMDRRNATDEECRDLPYVGLEHVEKEKGRFIDYFSPKPLKMLATNFRFTSKHVLYGKLRPYLNKVVLPYFDGVCTTEMLPILPDENEVDRIYLWAFLLSPGFVSWASSQVSGANLPRLDPKLLFDYRIPLPSLGEQRRIADLLRRADRLRRMRRYTRQLGETFLQPVFVEMFGEPIRNSKGWDIVKIEALLSKNRNGIQTGPFGSSLKKHEYVSSGIPVWGIKNLQGNKFIEEDSLFITNSKYEELCKYSVENGDIFISRAGTVGKMCVAYPTHPHSIIGTNLIRISLDFSVIIPEYFASLFTYFGTSIGSLKMTDDENAYSFINPTVLKAMRIPIPPLSTQKLYASIVSHHKHLLAKQCEAERQAEGLFQALLERSFGEGK